jgi:menaquinone-dependent protoporphyrinogen oxidase
VVAGSAIHGQKWLPEAMQFMRDYQTELSQKPFASFMVCITLSMTNSGQYLEGLKGWMSPVRYLVRSLSEGYFAGALDFSKLPFSFNVLMMHFPVLFGMWKEGDHRDWNAIRAWAESLRPLLIY